MADQLTSSSSLKVPYNLRPAKQAERRMLLDLYQGLIDAGFPIPNYHYLGFGSVFFVDFRILHKLLRLSKMTSVEGFDGLWKRCGYNIPFSNVNLFEGLSSELIPGLSKDELYLAWFDYDFPINKIVADDIVGLCSTLRPWSLAFFTIDLEKADEMPNSTPSAFFEFFSEQLPEFVIAGFGADDFKPPVREGTILSMLERCVTRGLKGRSGVTFEYLVRLTYADGHRMLTVGGMIADATARSMLSGDSLADFWFLSREKSGGGVEIPKIVLTPKEVAILEQHFPTGTAPHAEMGLQQADIDAFKKFYRYWPSYAESLV